MLAAGVKAPVPLDELESHLREDIERQMKSGLSEQQAFAMAVQQIGEANALKTEFKKNGESLTKQQPLLLMVCATVACLVNLFGGFFVIYWAVIDLQTPPDEEYRNGAIVALLLGLLMTYCAIHAAFICLRKMKARPAQ